MSHMKAGVLALAAAACFFNSHVLQAQGPDENRGLDVFVLDLMDQFRRSQSNQERRLLVNQIGKCGKKAAIAADLLIGLLADKDEEMRRLAIRGLGSTGETVAIPQIRKHLSSPSPETRLAAVSALASLGDFSAVPDLVKALKDPDSGIRANAAACLGISGMQDPHAFMPLIWCLHDPDYGVRLHASGSIRQYDGVEKVVPLIEILSEGDEHLSTNAASALDGYYKSDTAVKAFERLWNRLDDLRKKVWGAFGIVKGFNSEKAFLDLQALVKDSSPEVRANAVTAIGLLCEFEKDRRERILKSAFKDESAEVRARSIACLILLNLKRNLEIYLKALEDPSPKVVARAVHKLSVSSAPESVRPLIEVFNSSELFLSKQELLVEVHIALNGITGANLKILSWHPERMYKQWLEWYEFEGYVKFPPEKK